MPQLPSSVLCPNQQNGINYSIRQTINNHDWWGELPQTRSYFHQHGHTGISVTVDVETLNTCFSFNQRIETPIVIDIVLLPRHLVISAQTSSSSPSVPKPLWTASSSSSIWFLILPLHCASRWMINSVF